jgi:hypothetical protein
MALQAALAPGTSLTFEHTSNRIMNLLLVIRPTKVHFPSSLVAFRVLQLFAVPKARDRKFPFQGRFCKISVAHSILR